MTEAIKLPETTTITVERWPGFSVIVPNGTSLVDINHFAGAVLDWTNEQRGLAGSEES